MTVVGIAHRVILEIVRERRTLAFFFAAPVLVMTLIYVAIAEDETAKIGVLTRGPARLFEGELLDALEEQDGVTLIELDIPDDEIRPDVLERQIRTELRAGHADGIIFMKAQLLVDRFDGKPGQLEVYVEGSRPTLTAAVLGAMAGAMDDLAAALPVVIDANCPGYCADSVNSSPIDLEKIYLYGSDDYRMVDFFLPVLPLFFVFFFTFVTSTITFQRERVRGTLERLLVAPVSFAQVVFGYLGGFFAFTAAQSAIILTYFLFLMSFPVSAAQIGSMALLTVLMMLIALLAGLLASFLAHNEFQALQFIPIVILPQLFLGDIIWSIDRFPALFRAVSLVLPLTHANAAMRNVVLRDLRLVDSWPQIAVLVGFIVVIFAILAAIGRRPGRVVD